MNVRNAAGASVPVVSISMRDASNTLRSVRSGNMRTADDASHAIFTALTPLLSTTSVQGSGNSRSPITISTNAVQAAASGAVNPTYQWNQTDAGSAWSAITPTANITQFRCTSVAPGDSETTTFACTITDGSLSVTTANVVATVTNIASV